MRTVPVILTQNGKDLKKKLIANTIANTYSNFPGENI